MRNGFYVGAGAFHGYRQERGSWGKVRQDSTSIGLYGGYAPAATGIRLALGSMYQSFDLETRRNSPNGAGIASARGETSGRSLGLTGHAGWVFGITDALSVQPFAQYTRQWTHLSGYQEHGAPFLAKYDSQNYTQNITRTGAEAQWDVLPHLSVECWLAWNHRFEDKGPASSGSMNINIPGLQSFKYEGQKLKRNWGDTGVGLRWRMTDNTTLGMRLNFGIDNKNSGLPDMMSTMTLSVAF